MVLTLTEGQLIINGTTLGRITNAAEGAMKNAQRHRQLS
jgi:hypothetical protein